MIEHGFEVVREMRRTGLQVLIEVDLECP
jgi:hypothetical protein